MHVILYPHVRILCKGASSSLVLSRVRGANDSILKRSSVRTNRIYLDTHSGMVPNNLVDICALPYSVSTVAVFTGREHARQWCIPSRCSTTNTLIPQYLILWKYPKARRVCAREKEEGRERERERAREEGGERDYHKPVYLRRILPIICEYTPWFRRWVTARTEVEVRWITCTWNNSGPKHIRPFEALTNKRRDLPFILLGRVRCEYHYRQYTQTYHHHGPWIRWWIRGTSEYTQ